MHIALRVAHWEGCVKFGVSRLQEGSHEYSVQTKEIPGQHERPLANPDGIAYCQLAQG